MNDRTVHQACRAGMRTVPVDKPSRPKQIRGNITLAPDELALAVELARAERVEQDIRDYKHRRRTA